MDAAQDEVLTYMDFPNEHWLQIHSTNPLERLNTEIKRRTHVVGIFPNEGAITRLVGAMLSEQSDEWALQRRYLQLEGLQVLSDMPRSAACCAALSNPCDPADPGWGVAPRGGGGT